MPEHWCTKLKLNVYSRAIGCKNGHLPYKWYGLVNQFM